MTALAWTSADMEGKHADQRDGDDDDERYTANQTVTPNLLRAQLSLALLLARQLSLLILIAPGQTALVSLVWAALWTTHILCRSPT